MIPVELCNIFKLDYLYLIGNNSCLSLGCTNMKKFPEFILELDLVELVITDAQIETIPIEICNLTNLNY